MSGTRSTNRYSALQSLIADQDTEIEDELAKGESLYPFLEGSREEGGSRGKRTLHDGGCACSSATTLEEQMYSRNYYRAELTCSFPSQQPKNDFEN